MADDFGRTRMNLKQNAKGLVQMDVTAEYSTPEETANNLSASIDLFKKVCAEKGLQIAAE